MEKEINHHYSSDNLAERILQAFSKAGKDPDNLQLKDMSVIDQLHTGGHLATLALGEKAGLKAGMTVLDVGCGIGGTSRLLAETFKCKVIGLDLVQAFVDAAIALTRAARLNGDIKYIPGNACAMPVDDASVDCVWSQHTLMNIQDKPGIFKEFARVLKPGGMLVLHEIARGTSSAMAFPVPWADRQEISFLAPWNETRTCLAETGFTERFDNDITDQAKAWWTKVKAAFEKMTGTPKPLGPHIVFGDNGKHFGNTMTANLDNDCIRLMEAVYVKTS